MKTINKINRQLKRSVRLTAAIFCATFLVACKKDKTEPQPIDNNYVQHGNGVFVGNEGQFQAGNASVLYYRFGDEKLSVDLYHQVNAQPLGDVLQSLFVDGDRLYAVLNNSKKIEAMQMPSFTKAGTITGLPSPRYMVKTSDDVAFVTNLFGSSISKVSLSQLAVVDSIPMPDGTEAIAFHNGKLFVTAANNGMLYACDPTSLQIVDSVFVGVGGNGLVTDKNGMLWVLCAGLSWVSPPIAGALVHVNPNAMQVLNSYDLGIGSARSLVANSLGDTLYFLNNDVFRLSINDATVPPAFVPADGRTLYGLYRHPTRNELFVTDAKDFMQNGDVSVYSTSGALQKTMSAGLAPSAVLAY